MQSRILDPDGNTLELKGPPAPAIACLHALTLAACPLTLLLPEVARGERDLQNAFAQRTEALLDRVASHFPEIDGMSRREAALAVYTSCVGAVVLARAVAAPDARQRITRATEKMLLRALALETPASTR